VRLREVSLAVRDASSAAARFSALLAASSSDAVEVHVPPVDARFFSLDTGPVSVALMESTAAGSAIERFLERRGEGLFSITFEVDDIVAEMARMREAGAEFVLDDPLVLTDYSTGHARYRECLVAFTRPASTGHLLIELQELRP
jgi:methylmalonyl-CoA/ethylmalonyl-CoA epimerase